MADNAKIRDAEGATEAIRRLSRQMTAWTESSTESGPSATSSRQGQAFDRALHTRLARGLQAKYKRSALRSPDEKREAMTYVCDFCAEPVPPVELTTPMSLEPDADHVERTSYRRGECDCEASAEYRRAEAAAEAKAREADRKAAIESALRSRYEYSGLSGLGLMDRTFDSFDADRQPEAFAAARDFAENADGRAALILAGPNGLGKSHLAIAIVHHWIRDRGISAKFYSAWRLWSRIRNTYNDWGGEGEAEIYNEVATAPLVILDDVGRRHTNTEASRDFYDRIIGARYDVGRPVVVTTNHEIAHLEDWVTLAGFSRLAEMAKRGAALEMTGDDYRLR